MLKLYKIEAAAKLYWETWENKGVHTVHWGELGTPGSSKEIEATVKGAPQPEIQDEIDALLLDGYQEIEPEDMFTLIVEYQVDGMGSGADVDKRHRLEDRLNETLGWTGLGNCDGGSIGSGTMESCCFVVDFALAKRVIEADLAGTEFGDFIRIYDEDSDG